MSSKKEVRSPKEKKVLRALHNPALANQAFHWLWVAQKSLCVKTCQKCLNNEQTEGYKIEHWHDCKKMSELLNQIVTYTQDLEDVFKFIGIENHLTIGASVLYRNRVQLKAYENGVRDALKEVSKQFYGE